MDLTSRRKTLSENSSGVQHYGVIEICPVTTPDHVPQATRLRGMSALNVGYAGSRLLVSLTPWGARIEFRCYYTAKDSYMRCPQVRSSNQLWINPTVCFLLYLLHQKQ